MRAGILRATALLLPLGGCVNMSGLSGDSKYACAAPVGVACDSVSGTYTNAVRSNLPSQRARPAAADGTPSPAPQGLPSLGTAPAVAMTAGSYQHHAGGAPAGLALRSQARVLRLWTKPWEDADGDLWDQGYVYVQVDAGRWQIDHVRQRIRDQYAPLRPPSSAASNAPPLHGASAPEAAGTGPDTSAPAEGTLQRPSSFNPFPSLARPPASLGSRSQ